MTTNYLMNKFSSTLFFCFFIGSLFLTQSCQQESIEQEKRAIQDALEIDNLEMKNRYKAKVSLLENSDIEYSKEAKAMNLALDASAAQEIEAILAQLAPDRPLRNSSPGEKVDSNSIAFQLEESPQNIENGAMLIGVRDYDETYQNLRKLVQEYQAIIESEEERKTEFRLESSLIIRINPTKFTEFCDKVRSMAVFVHEKRLWKQDLSSQFVDIRSRLNSKQEAKLRLEQFLRSARNANEILPIQRELDAVTEEIEALTRTARSLVNKAVSSTISITFYQQVLKEKAEEAAFGERFVAGAKDGWVNFKEFLIQVALLWPYVAIAMVFLLSAALALHNTRRRNRRFRAEAMQIQQQWLAQQQQNPNQNNKHTIS